MGPYNRHPVQDDWLLAPLGTTAAQAQMSILTITPTA